MNNSFDFSTNTLIIGGGPEGSTLARKLSKIILIISFFKIMTLKNDSFMDLMFLLFSKKKFQEKCLGYWEWSLKPISIYKIPFKILKYIFKK